MVALLIRLLIGIGAGRLIGLTFALLIGLLIHMLIRLIGMLVVFVVRTIFTHGVSSYILNTLACYPGLDIILSPEAENILSDVKKKRNFQDNSGISFSK